MVEYYEGLLMAVDSLKRTGTSIDLSLIHISTTADCALIQKLAQQIFPVTYKAVSYTHLDVYKRQGLR